MSAQLTLFDEGPTPFRDDGHGEALRRVHDEARRIRAGLPDSVHFGTSSWSFPGWRGLVYSTTRSQTSLAREGLREYARHPLLTTVGVDRSYYAPMPVADLVDYAAQLPEGFKCCFKAPAAVTAAVMGPPGRQTPNPDFLSVDRLVSDLLTPLGAVFGTHTGPIVLEFPPVAAQYRLASHDFETRLDRFLGALPTGFDYAVELRDRRLLTPRYRSVLNRHGIAHTYNYWSAMPGPADQASVVPPESGPFVVIRLLLRPGTWYEDQRDRFKPFDRLVAPDESMRAAVVAVTRRALARRRPVWILVNNKAEGSSPLTVMALAKRLQESMDRP